VRRARGKVEKKGKSGAGRKGKAASNSREKGPITLGKKELEGNRGRKTMLESRKIHPFGGGAIIFLALDGQKERRPGPSGEKGKGKKRGSSPRKKGGGV